MRAVAGERRGDRGADAARRAGDERDLAVQRALPVDRDRPARRRRSRRPARRRTPSAARAGSAASRRARPRRRGRRARGCRSRRRAAPWRPSARSPRARAARWPRVGSCAPAGGVPSTTSAARRLDAADRRVHAARRAPRGACCRRSRVASNTSALEARVARRLGVEHGGVEARVRRGGAEVVAQRRGGLHAGGGEGLGDGRREAAALGAREEHRALDHRRAGRVTLEHGRLRQRRARGDDPPDRRVDDLLVEAHCPGSFEDRDDALAAGRADADDALAAARARAAPWPGRRRSARRSRRTGGRRRASCR